MTNYQGIDNSQSASASLNFRKNKWAISSNLNSRNQIRNQQYDMSNGDSKSSNNSVGYVKNGTFDLGGYLNIDYDISDNKPWDFLTTLGTARIRIRKAIFLTPLNSWITTMFGKRITTELKTSWILMT
jgi:hypothetical protein